MKLKDLFKITVWRSKTSRGDGGQRPLNHRPQRWWRAAALQRCRYSTAALQDQPGPETGHSQLIEKGLWHWIFNYTQASSEGTTVKPEDPFFLSRLFQNIKLEASSVMA